MSSVAERCCSGYFFKRSVQPHDPRGTGKMDHSADTLCPCSVTFFTVTKKTLHNGVTCACEVLVWKCSCAVLWVELCSNPEQTALQNTTYRPMVPKVQLRGCYWLCCYWLLLGTLLSICRRGEGKQHDQDDCAAAKEEIFFYLKSLRPPPPSPSQASKTHQKRKKNPPPVFTIK